MRHLYLAWIILVLAACQQASQPAAGPRAGIWRGELTLEEGVQLPFFFEVQQDTGLAVVLLNADERLPVEAVSLTGDSLWMRTAVFGSTFHTRLTGDSILEGYWHHDYRGPDHQLAFRATAGDQPLFPMTSGAPPAPIEPVWEVIFSPEDRKTPAIGEFRQQGQRVTGTFLTETGDYRYLDGSMDGRHLRLATFDGSHAFLFSAVLYPNGGLMGEFRSGAHWKEPWIARPNPQASLRPADSLTFLKPGYTRFELALPDLQGDTVSLADAAFQNKVVIVQIMGSWCPNCMDETRLLAEWHRRYQAQGLEVVGVAFERAPDVATARGYLEGMKARLGADYTVLLAATDNSPATAAAVLPMLNHIMSFPTSIYIDRKGQVRRIHTGFSGPGTGDHYLRFREEYEAFIEKMLAE
ncbi:MAG: hypothetical protein OHK0039_07820 [Bacteroidia bacterium]